jgi:AAA15 family ATPase/GTPase
MLTKISLKHYKAFEDASVEIKPITILLGANSVGKSSIIQLFLMLQQTGKAGLKSYKSALKLYGGYVNLGDATNLFRKKDTTKPVSITIEVNDKNLRNFLNSSLIDSFIRVFQLLPMIFPIKGFSELREKSFKNKTEFSNYLEAIISVISKSTLKGDYRKEIGMFVRHRNEFPIPQLTKENKGEFVEAFDFLNEFPKKIKTDNFQVTYELMLNDSNNLEVSKFIIKQDNLLSMILGFGLFLILVL